MRILNKLRCWMFGHRFVARYATTPIFTDETLLHREWQECRCGQQRQTRKEWLTGKRIQYPVYGASGGLQLQYKDSAHA